jgi:hypothetical protein
LRGGECEEGFPGWDLASVDGKLAADQGEESLRIWNEGRGSRYGAERYAVVELAEGGIGVGGVGEKSGGWPENHLERPRTKMLALRYIEIAWRRIYLKQHFSGLL